MHTVDYVNLNTMLCILTMQENGIYIPFLFQDLILCSVCSKPRQMDTQTHRACFVVMFVKPVSKIQAVVMIYIDCMSVLGSTNLPSNTNQSVQLGKYLFQFMNSVNKSFFYMPNYLNQSEAKAFLNLGFLSAVIGYYCTIVLKSIPRYQWHLIALPAGD